MRISRTRLPLVSVMLSTPLLTRDGALDTMQQLEDTSLRAQSSHTLTLSARERIEMPRAITTRMERAPSVIPASVSNGAARQLRRNQHRLPTQRGRR
jgi:hypothetical protein